MTTVAETPVNAPITVGVDGSPESLAAVRLAAQEAVHRHRRLRVVHGFAWPYLHVPLGPHPLGPTEGGLRNAAEQLVAEAVGLARRIAPEAPVDGAVVPGFPAAVLVAESRQASLLVLGDRGLGGFTGLVVGSVAVQLSCHARCPILVVRGPHDQIGRAAGDVVVGVDGSELAAQAVGFAFEEAAWRGTGLTAVHAWTSEGSRPAGDARSLTGAELSQPRTVEEIHLAESVAAWRDKYPEVPLRCRVVHGAARDVLLAEAAGAQLLVVGCRGRGGFTGLVLGSVSQAVLHHAPCPVAIIHPQS